MLAAALILSALGYLIGRDRERARCRDELGRVMEDVRRARELLNRPRHRENGVDDG